MNAALVPAVTGDEELTTDGVRGFAVHAGARLGAGCGQAEALGVYRRRHVPGPLHGSVNVTADLVHAHDKNHLFGPLGNGGNPIGVSVDVHKHPILRHG